jgi:hypothetical protein
MSGQLHAPFALTPVKSPVILSIKDCLGPRDSQDVQGRQKSLACAGFRWPDHPARSLVTLPTVLLRLPLRICVIKLTL